MRMGFLQCIIFALLEQIFKKITHVCFVFMKRCLFVSQIRVSVFFTCQSRTPPQSANQLVLRITGNQARFA